MGRIRQTKIKNRTYYFHRDRINLEDFDASLLKVDKRNYKEIDSMTLVMWLLKKLLIATILTV